jgi:hypothetical protein
MKIIKSIIILFYLLTSVSCGRTQIDNNKTPTTSIVKAPSMDKIALPTLNPTNVPTSTNTLGPTITNTSTPEFTKPCYIISTKQFNTTKEWKVIKSQGGWKVKYPPNWIASSCRNCWDLTEKDVPILIQPNDTFDLSIHLGGGKYNNGDSISAYTYFSTIIESTNNIEFNYCLINGMPSLRRLSVYKNMHPTESIDIWNKDYRYFINYSSSNETIDQFLNNDHYLLFQLMASTFEENVLL